MNDVRELCELALDMPAPPMPSAAEALSVAQRSARLRTTAIAGAAIASVAAVIAAAAVFAGPAEQPRRTMPAASATWPHLAADRPYEATVSNVLISAVPAGFTARAAPGNTDYIGTWQFIPRSDEESTSEVMVSAGSRKGVLEEATMLYETPVPTGDLCHLDGKQLVRMRVDIPPWSRCEILVVGGVSIQVTTTYDYLLGTVLVATRFINGGIIEVTAQQGIPAAWDKPAIPTLRTLPFTAADLAAIAANPVLLP
jgi:hypothetical protein